MFEGEKEAGGFFQPDLCNVHEGELVEGRKGLSQES